MSDPKYPYGASGFDPETGRYSWDDPVPVEDDEPEQQPENGTEENGGEATEDDDS